MIIVITINIDNNHHYLWFHVAGSACCLFLLEALIHVAAKAKDLGLPGGRFP